MSVTSVKQKTALILWGKAAGRCEYEGCNEPLYFDPLTKTEFNTSYIAHIIADKTNGPRGDIVLSEKLKNDISNLMLLCDIHHRLIDKEDVVGHPVERLQLMKKIHEERIELYTSIIEDKGSHILLYAANIGKNNSKVSWKQAALAMAPDWFPAEKSCFELSLGNSSFQDNNKKYWEYEKENLQNQFLQKVKPRLQIGDIQHLSIFGIAPQPLLIELGRLVSDIMSAEVYQLQREPKQTWRWQSSSEDFHYKVEKPEVIHNIVALNISLSARIDNERIHNVIGKEVSIWTLSIENPNNNFMKDREHLRKFREILRLLFDEIKFTHGHNNILHVFPSMPVSAAIETGRVWMPKADLPIRVYDENRGFKFALDIN